MGEENVCIGRMAHLVFSNDASSIIPQFCILFPYLLKIMRSHFAFITSRGASFKKKKSNNPAKQPYNSYYCWSEIKDPRLPKSRTLWSISVCWEHYVNKSGNLCQLCVKFS